MKFTQAKKYMESQEIRIGIGFHFTGKKLEDFGPVLDKGPDEFPDDASYEAEKKKVQGDTEKAFEEAKALEDPKVELVFRQPTLDEMISLSKNEKKLPVSLNLEKPEIVKVVLEYFEDGGNTTMTQINNSLAVIEKCYIGDTFEDSPGKAKEIVAFIRSSKDLSIDVVQKFFAKVGK